MKKCACLIAVLLSLFFFSAGCSKKASAPAKKIPPLFAIGETLDIGAEPSYLIADDFDKNGHLDLLVSNSGDNTISYYKGKGDGTFQPRINFKTGHNPISVASGNFNGDAYPDFAELNYADQTIEVFLNTGRGSFKNTGNFLHPGKIPVYMITGDLNKDGVTDIVVAMRFHKVVVFWGAGSGKFSEPVSFDVQGQPTGLEIADYNGDGKLDIAASLAGSGNVGVQILFGKGNKEFESSNVFPGGGQPMTLANIDFNGDGLIDLVVSSNSHHSLTIFKNKGAGIFEGLKNFASGDFPKFVVVGDFNQDGKPDLAVSNGTLSQVSVDLGNGDGTFTDPPVYHQVDIYPQGIAMGDFNHDGLIDLAVACRDSKLIDIMLKKSLTEPLATDRPSAGANQAPPQP